MKGRLTFIRMLSRIWRRDRLRKEGDAIRVKSKQTMLSRRDKKSGCNAPTHAHICRSVSSLTDPPLYREGQIIITILKAAFNQGPGIDDCYVTKIQANTRVYTLMHTRYKHFATEIIARRYTYKRVPLQTKRSSINP